MNSVISFIHQIIHSTILRNINVLITRYVIRPSHSLNIHAWYKHDLSSFAEMCATQHSTLLEADTKVRYARIAYGVSCEVKEIKVNI